jgi:hypothetical protein
MAKAHAQTTIQRSVDDVWARIRDFGDISWVPNVASCTLDGKDRTITMQGASYELVERLLDHDDQNRRYSFCVLGELNLESVLGPGHVLRHLEATLAVTPVGDAAKVTWDVDTEEFLIEGTRAEYQAALENLRADLEA